MALSLSWLDPNLGGLHSTRNPHPSPLPEGEGTERGILAQYTDLHALYRIHHRHELSVRRRTEDNGGRSLSLGRVLGGRRFDEGEAVQQQKTPHISRWRGFS